jgi:hypothetical protein
VAGDLVTLLSNRAHDGGMGGGDLTQSEERGVGVMVTQERQEPLDALLDPTPKMAGDQGPRTMPKDGRVIVFLDVNTERVH